MDILLVVVFVLPALLYLAAWWQARRLTGVPVEEVERALGAGTQPEMGAVPPPAVSVVRAYGLTFWVVMAGVVLHAGSIALAMVGGPPPAGAPAGHPMVRFGFAQALSATMWLGVAMLWVESLRMRVEALQAIVLPIAAAAALLPLFFPGADLSALARQPLFVPHLLVGTLAYGVLMLAALHAGLMTAAERSLHRIAGAEHSLFARWFEHLPPLLMLERILFRFIAIGFGLLTLTVLSGAFFSEQVFGRPLRFDHKTVFTLLAWLLFGLLLLGRFRWGWRGRTALRLTLSGFAVLLLAYVGSHFVREVILQR
jgi:ABC-type uncharacterized transport system permease subunit